MKQSMLIQGEQLESMCEFAKDMLLISVSDGDLLVAENWRIVRRIEETDVGNIEKCILFPLPEFNPDSFPIFVSSGKHTHNVINVKTGCM